MGEVTWTAYATIDTDLDAELDSLADDGFAVSTTAYDNSSNRDRWADFEFYSTSKDLSSSVNPAMYIWFSIRFDGTNYTDADTTNGSGRPPDVIIQLTDKNAAHREIARGIPVPPENFKLLVQNKAGAALNADDNTIKFRCYSETVA